MLISGQTAHNNLIISISQRVVKEQALMEIFITFHIENRLQTFAAACFDTCITVPHAWGCSGNTHTQEQCDFHGKKRPETFQVISSPFLTSLLLYS